MSKRKRIVGFLLAALILTALLPGATAATRRDLDQPGVFLNQEYSGACVITSITMMVRRGAILQGWTDWRLITTDSIPDCIPNTFDVYGITVEKQGLPGGEANRDYLIEMLDLHPEGVVLYAGGVPHAVLLTDYTDGQFYCCDPAVCCPADRIPIEEAYGTRIENSGSIWCITTPLPRVKTNPQQIRCNMQSRLKAITLQPDGGVAALVGLTTLRCE